MTIKKPTTLNMDGISKTAIWVGVTGLVLLVIGVGGEWLIHHLNTYNTETTQSGDANQVFWLSVLEFVKQLGSALLVATVILYFVEKKAREEQAKISDELRQRISENVFEAVLGTNAPKEVVQQVMTSVFAKKVIRENMTLHYNIESVSDKKLKEITGGKLPKVSPENKQKYIFIDVENNYVLKNIGLGNANEKINVFIPFPNHTDLKDFATLMHVYANGQELNIKDGNEAIPDTEYEKKYSWPVKIKPKETLRVITKYRLVKERSDNEVFTSLFPTLKLQMTADMRIEDMEWDVDALHSDKIRSINHRNQSGPYAYERVTFETQAPILPYQGVLTWWRPKRQEEEKTVKKDAKNA